LCFNHDVVIELHRRSQIGRSMIETQSVCLRIGISCVGAPKALRNETAVAKNFLRSVWSAMRLRIVHNSGCSTFSND
jgi:hypothetical protein